MALFRRKKKSPARAPQATRAATHQSLPKKDVLPVDEFLGDTDLEAACTQLRAGSWDVAEALLAARPGDDSTWEKMARDDVPLEVYERWAEASPSAWTLTTLGAAHIAHGWKVRGEGVADTVSFSAFSTLDEHLEQARHVLHRAIEMDPASAAPYVQMITVNMATGNDLDELQRLYMAVHERSPFHPTAVAKALQAKCPKWGGSREAAFEFGNWVVANAPDGSSALVAAVDLQFEAALMETSKTLEIMSAMGNVDAQKEILNAFERFMIDMPEPAPTSALPALNRFLYWVPPFCVRSAELNLRAFRAVANRPTERPWDMLRADPIGDFQTKQQDRIQMSDRTIGNLTTLHRRLEAAGEFGISGAPVATPVG